MMSEERLIDEIVRGVLARLQNGEQSAPPMTKASGGRKPPDENKNRVPISHDAPGTKTIDADVITGELLDAGLDGAKTLVIGPLAVLTPSGRDVIRTRGLEIVRRQSEQQSPNPSWLILVSCTTPAVDAVLDEAAISAGVSISRELDGPSDEAARVAVGSICRADADGVLIFSRHPQLVACLANRNPTVRAAVISDIPTLKAVRVAMGANVICVDPGNRTYFELRNFLRELQSGKPPRKPKDWTE